MNIDRRSLLTGTAAMLLAPRTAGAAERRKMVITGHLGNIGARLLPYYRETWDVVGIDKKEGPEFDLALPYTESAWAKRLAGVHTIVHLAALAWPDGAPEPIYQNNVLATSNLIEAISHGGAHRIVFASSTWACPVRVGNPVGSYAPVNPYGASKLFGEGLLENAARDRVVAASVIRVGWVPRANADTSNAAPWLQKILWRDAELFDAFDQGVNAAANFIRIG